jgi:SAM-dependent methyltransferase
LTQEVDSTLRGTLSRIYAADANIGYLQPGYEIAAGYLKDFVDFLLECLPSRDEVRALEVGCGGCEVLDHLSQLGLEVLGIDPSPVARRIFGKCKSRLNSSSPFVLMYLSMLRIPFPF